METSAQWPDHVPTRHWAGQQQCPAPDCRQAATRTAATGTLHTRGLGQYMILGLDTLLWGRLAGYQVILPTQLHHKNI